MEELFQSHHAAALRYANRLVRDRHDAEDLTSQVFLGTFEQICRGRTPEATAAYLRTALRNRAANHYRARARLECREEVEGAQRLAESHLGAVPDFAEALSERHVIAEAMASLSRRHRLVLWRTIIEQRSVTEVAAELELTPNATRALAFRARNALREAAFAESSAGNRRVAAAKRAGVPRPPGASSRPWATGQPEAAVTDSGLGANG